MIQTQKYNLINKLFSEEKNGPWTLLVAGSATFKRT